MAVFGGCGFVPATNPFDPETDPELQARAVLRGSLVVEALPDASGIPVVVSLGDDEAGRVDTASDGSFSLELSPGTYRVDVKLEGYVSIAVPGLTLAAGETLDLGTLTLVLDAEVAGATSLRGTALLEGGDEHAGILVQTVGRGFTATTASDGSYVLGVVPGDYELRFTKDGFTPGGVSGLTVAAGEELIVDAVTLAFNPASVVGHVDAELIDGTFGPLAGASVSVDGTAVTAVADGNGDFALTGIPAGSHLVRVQSAGFTTVTVAVLDVAAGEQRALPDPVVLVRPRGTISGTVSLADSADASGVVVELSGVAGVAAVTDSSGGYTFSLIEGDYELRARRDDYVPRVIGTVSVVADGVVVAPPVTLARAGGDFSIIEGAVTNDAGVELVLFAADAVGFKASEDPTFSDPALGDVVADPFRAFVAGAPQPFTLSDVDGNHEIFVVFFDGVNESAPSSASIILDRAAPSAQSLVVNGAADGVDPAGGGAAQLFIAASGGIVSLSVASFDLPPPGAPAGTAVSGLARLHLAHESDFSDVVVQSFTTTPTFVLDDPATPGPKDIHVRFEDGAGNVSAPLSVTVTLDNDAPTAPAIVLDGGNAAAPELTRSPIVVALLDAVEENAGPAGENLFVAVSSSPGLAGAVFVPFTPDTVLFLSPTDGAKTIFARFRDAAGNESDIVFDSITLDATPPSAPSAAIVENDTRPTNGATNSVVVDVELVAGGNPAFAVVAESATLVGGTVVNMAGLPQPVTTSLTLGGDGDRTVFARFFDEAGNESALASAGVVVDITPPAALLPSLPAPPAGALAGFVTSTTLPLVMPDASQDDVSIAGNRTAPVGFVAADAGSTVNVTLVDSDGAKNLTFTWRDDADNQTVIAAPLTVTLDRAPPAAVAFTITGTPNTTVTSTTAVTLSFAGQTDATSGIVDMKFSSTATLADAAFVPFSTSAAFTLAPGDGAKTVFARFRDRAGLESSIVQGSITLNATPPTATSVIVNAGADFTTAVGTTLSIAAVGATEMALSQDNFASGTTFVPFATTVNPFNLVGADGLKTVSVKFRNSAQLEGASATDTITLDRAAPGAGTIALVGTLGNGASSNVRTSTPAIVAQLTRPTADTTEMALAQAASSAACAASDFASPNFQPFSPSSTFVLVGANGDKRVCVIFRDAAGNFSTAAHAGFNLRLDTSPPTSPAFAPQPPSFTQAATQLVTVTASTDNLAGTVTYQCRGGSFGNDFVDCGTAASLPFALSDNAVNEISVRARDDNFNVSDAASAIITHDDIPPLPPALRALTTTQNTVSVSWDDSPSADVARYVLSYGVTPGDEGGAGADQGDSPIDVSLATAIVLSGLTEGASYYVRVAAIDAAGNVGQPSGELVGVPAPVSQRLLSAFGGEIHQLGAQGTNVYVAQSQSVLKVDSGDNIIGRATLPNVVPDDHSRMLVRACTVESAVGDCLFIPGYALEGEFRGADGDQQHDGFRAGVSVVFFAAGGDVLDPVRGKLVTTLAVRARHIVFDTTDAVLYAVEEETPRGVSAFDISDVSEPLFLGSTPHVRDLDDVRGAGLDSTGELLVLATTRANPLVTTLFGYDTNDLLAGSAVTSVEYGDPTDAAGETFGNPDQAGASPVFIGGALQIVIGDFSTMKVARYNENGVSFPAPEQELTIPACSGIEPARIVPTAVSGTRLLIACGVAFAPGAQVARVDVTPTLTLVDTDGAFPNPAVSNPSGMVAAAVTTAGTPRFVVAREVPFAVFGNPVVQPLESWNVNAATLTQVRSKAVEAAALTLDIHDDVVVAVNATEVVAVDIRDPLVPRRTAPFVDPAKVYDRVKIQENLAFVSFTNTAGTTGGIDVFALRYDVADVGLGVPKTTIVGPGAPVYADFAVVGRRVIAVRRATATMESFVLNIAGTGNAFTLTPAAPVACNLALLGGTTFQADMIAVRHDTAYVADSTGLFRVINHRACTATSATLTPPTAVLFPSGGVSGGAEYLAVSGTVAVLSDRSRSYQVNIANPAAPSYDTTIMPISGPVAQAGGYIVGGGPSTNGPDGEPDSGPRYVVGGSALFHGAFPFAACGDDASLASSRAGLASPRTTVTAACGLNGVLVTTPVNPSGGKLLKEVPGGWSTNAAALAVDGNFSYLAARQVGPAPGTQNTIWHANEQGLAAGVFTVEPALNNTLANGTANISFDRGSVFAILRSGATQTLTPFDASDADTAWVQGGAGTVVSSSFSLSSDANSVATGRFLHLPQNSQVLTFDVGERNAAPVLVETYPVSTDSGRAVAVYRDRLYFQDAGQIRVFNIANPVIPTQTGIVGSFAMQTPLQLAGIAVGSGHLFSVVKQSGGPSFIDVYRLGKGGDAGSGFAYIGTLQSALPLGEPTIVGDVLYVRENLGIAAFDLTPLFVANQLPVRKGSIATNDATYNGPVAMQIRGPYAFLLGDRYRVFDLR